MFRNKGSDGGGGAAYFLDASFTFGNAPCRDPCARPNSPQRTNDNALFLQSGQVIVCQWLESHVRVSKTYIIAVPSKTDVDARSTRNPRTPLRGSRPCQHHAFEDPQKDQTQDQCSERRTTALSHVQSH